MSIQSRGVITMNLMTIGEFANLTGLTRQTLIFYDNSEVLKPVERKENGYRYYSKKQIYEAFSIRLLQNLDYSLSQIRDLIKHPENWELQEVICNQIEKISFEEKMLKEMKSILERKLDIVTNAHPNLNNLQLKNMRLFDINRYGKGMELSEISMSKTIQLMMGRPQIIYESPEGIVIEKNNVGNWIAYFYRKGKVKKTTDKKFATVSFTYSDIIAANFFENLDEVFENFSNKLNYNVKKEIYVETVFLEGVPKIDNNLIFDIYIPIVE